MNGHKKTLRAMSLHESHVESTNLHRRQRGRVDGSRVFGGCQAVKYDLMLFLQPELAMNVAAGTLSSEPVTPACLCTTTLAYELWLRPTVVSANDE